MGRREHVKKHLKRKSGKILSVLLIMVITLESSEFAFFRIAKIEENECWQMLANSAQAINNEIIVRFEGNMNTLRLMSGVMVQEKKLYSYDEIVDHMNAFCDRTMFKRIEVIYPDSTLLFQTGETIDISDHVSFEELASKGEHISERTVDLIDKESIIIRCYVPIIEDNKTAAILVGVIDCTQLSKILKTKAYSGEAYACILDRSDGSFIMDDWHDKLGNMYEDMEKHQHQPKKGYEHINLIDEVKKGKTGVTAFVSEQTGVYSYMYYMPIGIFDWQLLVVVENHVAFSSLYKVRKILLAIGTVEFLLVTAYFGIFLLGTRRLEKSKIETEKQLMISNTLVECIKTLSNHTDTNKAINSMLEIVTRYFQGERAYLFEFDYEKQTTTNTYEYAIDGVTKEINNLQDVPISAVAYWIQKFNETGMFCISDIDKELDKNTNTYEILSAQNIHSLISVPLKKDNEMIGFFGVDNPKINYDDLSLLSSVTFFLSDSLEKRHQQEILEQLSYEDTLTKLYNRNKFEQVIEELKEHRPQNLGIAYIDLNGLKAMNDKFGHKAGDGFIKKAAKSISRVFGENAFRIGGDEFVVLVVNIEQTVFQNEIEQMSVFMEEEEVSVSIGISWTDENVDVVAQMHEADEKMYENKKKYYENSAVDRRKKNR